MIWRLIWPIRNLVTSEILLERVGHMRLTSVETGCFYARKQFAVQGRSRNEDETQICLLTYERDITVISDFTRVSQYYSVSPGGRLSGRSEDHNL